MDFFRIVTSAKKKGVLTIRPSFIVTNSTDILIRGKDFLAIWDEDLGLWNRNEYRVIDLIDRELYKEKDRLLQTEPESDILVSSMRTYDSNVWSIYKSYLSKLPDSDVLLDNKVIFANQQTTKTDYATKRLPYSLSTDPCPNWDELLTTLYSPEEREKIEWAIGSIFNGDSKTIQKFFVFFGKPGTGKSTILTIIQQLFSGYYTIFDAKALVTSGNAFSMEPFKNNPLVAIQHDGDLSKIEDNTKLNSIVAHELMIINEKNKPTYVAPMNATIFLGTNNPVKISDSKSGILRRLIDISPTGNTIPSDRYDYLLSQIPFELGQIANHCLQVYSKLGKNYYDHYIPVGMMFRTDVFFNFVEENYLTFKQQDSCTLKQAWNMYKQYCSDSSVGYILPMYKFREELKSYFTFYYPITRVDGHQIRSYYQGFKTQKFLEEEPTDISTSSQTSQIPTNPLTTNDPLPQPTQITLLPQPSLLDQACQSCKAQYADQNGIPQYKWDNVQTTLQQIDTSKTHYILLDDNHIVIDFDLKNPQTGEKDLTLNLQAASKFPPTYSEVSKSGKGLHLHYIYDGDATRLSRIYDTNIEIKVFTGNASLRRKLTLCTNTPIAHISSGLPIKEVKSQMINFDSVLNEKKIRNLIERNLRKEIHPGTKPSIDFIYTILQEQYEKGAHYDISDMRPAIMAFAANSTNHPSYCLKKVAQMKFKSDEPSEPTNLQPQQIPTNPSEVATDDPLHQTPQTDIPITFFDVEVFPNLFLINWKYDGPDHQVIRMINPTPQDVEQLLTHKLVGFNNRKYDNHIIYARYLGYSNEQLYNLSQAIINPKIKGDQSAFFQEAFNLSYTDIYDFASAGNKKGLKKWEVELGLHHKELGLPWDQPVPEDKWTEVAEYCDNDVISTEAVFHHLSGDWAARQILADISGLTVNHTTNQLSRQIIFGKDTQPQTFFNYWDLSKPVFDYESQLSDETLTYLHQNTPLPLHFVPRGYPTATTNFPVSVLPYFPDYTFKDGKSTYRGEEVGEGGYVYSEPGIYHNVALLDIASMHPTSIECMALFGKYTLRFSEIKQSRIAIKHKDYDTLKTIMDGKLAPYVQRALDGDFNLKDLSNAMKTVINSVYGLTAARFPNAFRDPRNIDNIVAKRGALFMIDLKNAVQQMGYTVAHIKTDSIKIPNASPDIIKFVMDFGKYYGYTFEHEATYEKMCLVNDAVYIAKYAPDPKDPTTPGKWTATGAQFMQPYVFKTLFSHEPITFKDLCEVKSVSNAALYLDFNESLPPDQHNYVFVGSTGLFSPIKPGKGGGLLMRGKDGKYSQATGTTGFRWMESEVVEELNLQDDIDLDYYRSLVDAALANISNYGDPEIFISDLNVPPWCPPQTSCDKCPDLHKCMQELPF